MSGEINHLECDIASYIRFRRECYGEQIEPENIDFEEFLGYLDIEHYLRLRGTQTWSEDGNESQVIVKTAIGQILMEATPPCDELPKLYLDFAKELEPHDVVLTFNYDIILERALEAEKKPFRRFPNRYAQAAPEGFSIDTEKEDDEIAIFKMHGSVDWFDRSSYSYLEDSYREGGFPEKPPDAVFGPESNAEPVPLLEGDQPSDDPLRHIYRAINVDPLYDSHKLLSPGGPVPWLLTPSKEKILYAYKLKGFWEGMGREGGWTLGLVIIGYSLPKHDAYVLQGLFSLITNYQNSWWDEEFLGPGGMRKQPVILVDYRPDMHEAEEYRNRYRFVDEQKAKFHFGGFNDEALRLIRSTFR